VVKSKTGGYILKAGQGDWPRLKHCPKRVVEVDQMAKE
jgi:hypothetical protein